MNQLELIQCQGSVACRSNLVEYGPKVQAEKIFQSATSWLENGIKGRELMQPGGPLSSFQISGMSPDSIDQTFLMLLDSFANRIPEKARTRLAEWVVSEAVACSASHADSVIRICLLTAVSFAQQKDRAASMIAMAAAVGQSAFTSKPQRVIHGFGTILLPEKADGESTSRSESLMKTICGKIFLGYLQSGAKIADYSVRRLSLIHI